MRFRLKPYYRSPEEDLDAGGSGGGEGAADTGDSGAAGSDAGTGGDAGAPGAAASSQAAAATDGAAKGGKGPAASAGGKQADSPAIWWKEDWRAQAAKGDAKTLARLERYASPEAALNALASVQQRISAGELRSQLRKDATPEELAQWRQENGIPDAADKYDLKLSDGLVIGDDDKPIIDAFLKDLHGKNLSNDMASAVVDWYYRDMERQVETREQEDQRQATDAQDALRAQWGDSYRQNINLIEGMLDMAPPGVKDRFKFGRLADGRPILADPETIMWLNGLAREINPVTTVVPNAGANAAQAIDDEIKSIEKDMNKPKGMPGKHPYWDDDKRQARYRELLAARERVKERPAR
jgi:hypothetical protein